MQIKLIRPVGTLVPDVWVDAVEKDGAIYIKSRRIARSNISKIRTEPDWVCFSCAATRGAEIPTGHVYTVHEDICGICNTKQTVTEPRDFGRTRNLLQI